MVVNPHLVIWLFRNRLIKPALSTLLWMHWLIRILSKIKRNILVRRNQILPIKFVEQEMTPYFRLVPIEYSFWLNKHQFQLKSALNLHRKISHRLLE